MSKLPAPGSDPYTYKGHTGIDFLRGPSHLGKPFYASGPGTVLRLSKNLAGGCWVVVKYDNGYTVGYAHMRSHTGCPRPGTRVSEGTRLGYVGDLGARVTGPHIHVEIIGIATSAAVWQCFDRYRPIGQSALAGVSKHVTVNRPLKDIQRVVGTTQDGIWGPKTEAAVKVFQSRHGLTADGIWGPKSDAAGFPPASPAPVGSALIRAVQQKLKSNYPLYAGNLVVDGIQGPKTTAAIKEFQRRSGLTADGIVGPRTRRALGV